MLCMQHIALAQAKIGTVKGTVVDTAGKRPLASASINILDARDSSLITFARTKESGSFEITRLDAGNYLLLVSYTGFGKLQMPFAITAAKPLQDFGNLVVTSTATLADVVVTAAPIVVRGDTIEYNAASFKVNKPNAVVEDLLKKLPGVEVSADGTIKTNGQEVKRILVDGKQFFGNDPKLASKNLQVDMVNKVQVFDKKSDKSDFTGFDDGNSEPTINLTLKNDKRNGVFGKLAGGVGTDDRYKANANVNRFKKGEQLSFIGQANNINEQGFSLMDALSFSGGMGGATGGGRGGGAMVLSSGSGLNVQGFGGSSQGITSTQAIGTNYNNFKNNKLDFTSSYFFNGTQLENDYLTRRETFVGDTTQLYTEPGRTTRDNYNHRLNMGIDWKIDSANSIKITPAFTWQSTNNGSKKTYTTLGPKGIPLLTGFANTGSHNEGYNFSTTALYRHKFARKGRTFSTELRVGNNLSEGNGNQYTVNNSNTPNGVRTDSIRQINDTRSVAGSYSANVSYTEPLDRRSLLELSAFYNHRNNTSDRNTYDYNNLTQAYDRFNTQLSNDFENSYNYTGGGVNFKQNRKGWNYTVGANLQQAELSSLLQGTKTPISQKFFNVLPTAQLQISKNSYRNFRLFYNGSTAQPTVQQLQPVADISDPLNITIGNPNLKQTFTNNYRLTYSSFDPYTQKNFFAFASARQSFNAIVNNDSIGRNGGRTTRYTNADGVFNLNGNLNFGFPIKIGNTTPKINLNTSGSYNRNVNYLNNAENLINTYTLSQRVSINYNFKELFDVSLGGSVNWNKAKYSLQAAQNTNFYTYTGTLETNWYLPKNFTLGTTVDYTANTGRANGFNPNFTLWNASFGKSFLKNKRGELKLTVFDILNQNTGINRSTNSNYVEDTRYTVLKRYAMLTFTYSLSKFGNIGGGAGAPRIMMMGAPR